MEFLILGIIKILDNIISTAKTITTYQNKKIMTSLLVIISQLMFYYLIASVVEKNDTITTLMVCICSGIGTYIAMLINDKTKRDITYTNILTCSRTESVEDLCDYLLEHKIKYIALDSYNRKKEDTLTVLAFAQTKYESSLIDQFLETSNVKYLRQIIR